MSPHGTFSLESFILNFQILAPKYSALLSYKLRCLAHILIKSILECYAAKLLAFSLSCINLSRLDTFGLLFHLSKWYGPTNYSPYSSCTFKKSIAPLESFLFNSFHQASANSIKLPRIQFDNEGTHHR